MSFGVLPVQLIGVGLLVAAAVLMIVELNAPGFGLWGIAGTICLLLGGWFLYDRAGGVSVSPAVLLATAAFVGASSRSCCARCSRCSGCRRPGRGGDRRAARRRDRRRPEPRGHRPSHIRGVAAISADGVHGSRPARRSGSHGSTVSCSPSTVFVEHGRPPSWRPRKGGTTDGDQCRLDRADRGGLLVVLFLMKAIRIVPEYQRLVVFRLGRLLGQKGPGLVILIPFVDRGISVDLREFYLEIPGRTRSPRTTPRSRSTSSCSTR